MPLHSDYHLLSLPSSCSPLALSTPATICLPRFLLVYMMFLLLICTLARRPLFCLFFLFPSPVSECFCFHLLCPPEPPLTKKGGGGSIPGFSNLRANCQCVPGQDTASQTVLVVLEMYEWCVKEKGGMHIEAMYECVCESVNVTCSLKNWVVNKTTMGYNTVYLPFIGVAWTSTCDYSQMKGWLSSLMDGELGRGIIGAESQTPTFVFETQSSHLFPWKSEFRDPNSWELEAAAH